MKKIAILAVLAMLFGSFGFSGIASADDNSSAGSAANSAANTAPAAAATTTPANTADCGLQNGSLVKTDKEDTVYLVVNCTLRPFDSESMFHARGEKFGNVQTITLDQFNKLSLGKDVGESEDDNVPFPGSNGSSEDNNSSAPGATSSSSAGQASTLPDGSLVKVPGDDTVYMVTAGVLQPFDSASVFAARHLKFSDVKELPESEVKSLQHSAAAVPFPDNTLLKGSGSTIFMIKNGQKLGIPSMSVLEKHGSLKDVVDVPDHELQDITDGGVADN